MKSSFLRGALTPPPPRHHSSLFGYVPPTYVMASLMNSIPCVIASFMNSTVLKKLLWTCGHRNRNRIGTHFLWNRDLIIPDICHFVYTDKVFGGRKLHRKWVNYGIPPLKRWCHLWTAPQTRGQRESLFQLQDENENFFYSISYIETRREFFDT